MSEPATYGPLIESHCPQCDYKLTAASICSGTDQPPKGGDASVCLNCGQILIYRSDLTLRKATGSEVRDLMDDAEGWATIEEAQQFIHGRGRFA